MPVDAAVPAVPAPDDDDDRFVDIDVQTGPDAPPAERQMETVRAVVSTMKIARNAGRQGDLPDAVRACLQAGADPNYTVTFEGAASDAGQPTTPLRLVMFRISDCDLTDDDLRRYAEIARLLLRFGADPEPAMQIAESRYGPHDPSRGDDGPFMEVWNIVADAAGRSGEPPPTERSS